MHHVIVHRQALAAIQPAIVRVILDVHHCGAAHCRQSKGIVLPEALVGDAVSGLQHNVHVGGLQLGAVDVKVFGGRYNWPTVTRVE